MKQKSSGPDESPSETWRSAFFKQAKSDYHIFRVLNREGYPRCHQLHYLQMTTEKLAKGFFCAPESCRPPRPIHDAFVRFMQRAKKMSQIKNWCQMETHRYRNFIDGLLPIARQIEKLAPKTDLFHPNPEYPFMEKKTNLVISPVDYHFTSIPSLGPGKHPQMAKMLSFIEGCLKMA